MDRLEAMRAFVRVVEAGSFTRAAASLHVSKTTVSQLVQQLEAQLRVKLLNRTTRTVSLTGDGSIYYTRVVPLLAELDDMETSLPGAHCAPRGQLRIDVPSQLATAILIPALPDFHARFPDIQFEIGSSDRIVDLVGENVDCVVRGGSRILDPSLVARSLGQLQVGIYAAPAYLARHGTPLHPDEMGRHRLVTYRRPRTGTAFAMALRHGAETVALEGQHTVATNEGNAYLSAGLAGFGVLWLPVEIAQSHVERGALVRLFAHWDTDPMPLYVAYSPNRHVNKKMRVFIDWLVELFDRRLHDTKNQ